MQSRIRCLGHERTIKRRQVQRCNYPRGHLLCYDRREHLDGLGDRISACAPAVEYPNELQLEDLSSLHPRPRFADIKTIH